MPTMVAAFFAGVFVRRPGMVLMGARAAHLSKDTEVAPCSNCLLAREFAVCLWDGDKAKFTERPH